MFDFNDLDESTYSLLSDAAKRQDLPVNDYLALLINEVASVEYERQQIEDARTN